MKKYLPIKEVLLHNLVMKKTKFQKVVMLSSLLLSGVLFSCSTEGEENQKGSPVYQVDYFDEAGTQVGYAYVIEGKSGPFKSMEGVNYDWNPHSDLEISAPGKRYVFDKWVGTYDASYGKIKEGVDGQTVDLNSVQGNCKVVATFKEESYKIETSFRNNGKVVEGGTKVDFGQALSFPTANPSEEKPEYYNNYTFTGWTLSKDSSTTKHEFVASESPVYVWKAGANAGQAAWGVGAPEASDATGNEGVIYLDKTLTDHMPTYDTYISDGTKWVELGELSSNDLKIEFNSAYSKAYKEFTVTLMNPEKTATVATFNATYGDEITYDRTVVGDTTTIAVKYNSTTKYTYNLNTADKVSYLLEGKYLNKTNSTNKHDDKMDNTAMSFVINSDSTGVPVGGKAKIQGNVDLYPIVSDIH